MNSPEETTSDFNLNEPDKPEEPNEEEISPTSSFSNQSNSGSLISCSLSGSNTPSPRNGPEQQDSYPSSSNYLLNNAGNENSPLIELDYSSNNDYHDSSNEEDSETAMSDRTSLLPLLIAVIPMY